MKNLSLLVIASAACAVSAQTITNGDFSSTSNVTLTSDFRTVAGSDAFSYGRPVASKDTWLLGGEGSSPDYLGWSHDTVNDVARATLTQSYIDNGGTDQDRVMYYYTDLPSAGTYDFSFDYEIGSDFDGTRDGFQVQMGFVPEGFQLTKNRNVGDNWFTADNGSTLPAANRVYDSGVLSSGTGMVSESYTITATDVANYDYLAIGFIVGLDDESVDLANHFVTVDNVSIPEPSSLILMVLGFGAILLYLRRRQ